MTAISPPAYIQASSHPADVFRRAIQCVARGGYGVFNAATDLLVSANGTPNMSVNVAAGQAILPGTQNTTYQGVYGGALQDAVVNQSIAASDPTNPRIDLVVAQTRDAAYSGGNNDWVLAVVPGTPAASPGVPAAPANSISLAQVRVDAAVTTIVSGKITDVRPTLAGTAQLAGQFVGAGGNGGGIGSFSVAARFLGALASVGPPSSGTYLTGDSGLDSTGALWVCTAAGTPGTWRYVGGGSYVAMAYAGSAQAVNASSAAQLINCNTIDYDPHGDFNTTSHLYVCPVSGVYLALYNLAMDANMTLIAAARQSGSTTRYFYGVSVTNQPGNNPVSGGSTLIKAVAGDGIGLAAQYTSITTGNVWSVNDPSHNFIHVRLVAS